MLTALALYTALALHARPHMPRPKLQKPRVSKMHTPRKPRTR